MEISDIQRYDSKKMHEAYDVWPRLAKEYYEKDFPKLEIDGIDHIVFAGMGGSGTIGDIISSILSKTNIHVNVVKGYLLPKTVLIREDCYTVLPTSYLLHHIVQMQLQTRICHSSNNHRPSESST